MSLRLFQVLVCASTIALFGYTSPSAAQQVCNGRAEPNCDPRRRFRSLNGQCNNLQRPLLGAAFTAFRRLLPPDYADGMSEPRQSRRIPGQSLPLPNARNVSLAVFRDYAIRSTTLTHMAMVFGQFLAHDITLGEQPEDFTCDSSCQPVNECFGIPANKTGDPAFPGADGVNCIILRRNKPCTEDGPRQQVNLLTSYIDASHIYGNNREETNDVRDLSPNVGLLKTMSQNVPDLENLLPKADPHTPCRTSDPVNRPCFLTGDFRRNNENQALNVMHTIWVREHNRIATELRRLNQDWTGNRIFQETRKIVGAMMQHITYNEFLPAVLGELNVNRFNLRLLSRGRFTGYDPRVDPSIPNSMATAALRFGHSTIRNRMSRFDMDHERFSPIPVREFLNPEFLYEIENGGVDSILRGLAKDKANRVDGFFASAILQFHLGEGGQNGPSRGDLVAINMQRGRDHGLPGYNEFRIRAGRGSFSFRYDDLIPHSALQNLKYAYGGCVEDIDLFTGGILERPDLGSRVGPTFAHILGVAFKDLRRGDRFWYETDQSPVAFTDGQLRQLRKASLARIICDNSDAIHQIQPQVLRQRATSGTNGNTRCADLPFVGLQEWQA